ncbi:2714_t:CDS:1 [Paraglomus brasilianum]|uniref:2714_t:CDS:1 n=1 Tax=Paraglomus brasilianum TaxID=144538 RepID=A0A9N9AI62_9GLOM|nr:2714_t:CDS:1 [Paraglomus brasilianum]
MAKLINLILLFAVVLVINGKVFAAYRFESTRSLLNLYENSMQTDFKHRRVFVRRVKHKKKKKSNKKPPAVKPASKPAPKPAPKKVYTKNPCKSFVENFSKPRIAEASSFSGDQSSADWINLSGSKSAYTVNNGLLTLNLQKPSKYERINSDQGPYNKYGGSGATFNSSYLMHYGVVDITLKANPVGGCVTAFITMSPEGDEIDYEWVGKDVHRVQSNWYWNGVITWGAHGGIHEIPNNKAISDFNTYTIDWNPDRIIWKINGQAVRTLTKQETFENGIYKYPNRPSHIQFGIWDGSTAPGTANWANGPISWDQEPNVLTSQIDTVSIKCDPNFNEAP